MLSSNQDKFKKNEAAAKEVLAESLSFVKGGSTWGAHSSFDPEKKEFTFKKDEDKEKDKKQEPYPMSSELTYQKYDKLITTKALRWGLPYHDLESNSMLDSVPAINWLEERVYSIEKFMVGNCSELTALAFYLCLKKRIPAELYRCTNFDHAFLVIGRKPGSDPADPRTWGENAIICDPINNTCFPASDLYKKYKEICSKDVEVNIEFKEANTLYCKEHRNLTTLQEKFLRENRYLVAELIEKRKLLVPDENRLPYMSSHVKKFVKELDFLIKSITEEKLNQIYTKCLANARNDIKSKKS